MGIMCTRASGMQILGTAALPERAYILVKVPCECITGNIARGRGREPIKHEAQPSALFARDHAPSAIFSVMHERERYLTGLL